jgi:ABC-2 type transport system permease protein
MQAIYILWLRQVKRYYRSRPRMLGALGQPILFLFALGFGFGPVFAKAGQGDYLQFLVPGIISQSVLTTSIFAGIEIIWDRQFGFLKETLVAPVSRLSIMVGRTLGGATIAVIQGLIVLTISTVAGFRPVGMGGIVLAVGYMVLTSLLFTALGTAIASVLDDIQGFQLIMNFLVMPLFFLSGALFPVTGLPQVLRIVNAIDPLSYGVDGIRGALVGSAHFGLGFDAVVLGMTAALFLAAGSYLFSKIQL